MGRQFVRVPNVARGVEAPGRATRLQCADAQSSERWQQRSVDMWVHLESIRGSLFTESWQAYCMFLQKTNHVVSHRNLVLGINMVPRIPILKRVQVAGSPRDGQILVFVRWA